nr:hypothetical protein COLO4_04086 [Ipomoea trifida]
MFILSSTGAYGGDKKEPSLLPVCIRAITLNQGLLWDSSAPLTQWVRGCWMVKSRAALLRKDHSGHIPFDYGIGRTLSLARANRSNRLPWDGLRGILRNSPEQPFDSLALIRALGTDS